MTEPIQSQECPICLDRMLDPVELICLHTYCKTCVTNSIQHGQSQCFICEEKFSEIRDRPVRINIKDLDKVRKQEVKTKDLISKVKDVQKFLETLRVNDLIRAKLKTLELELQSLEIIRDRISLTLNHAQIKPSKKVNQNLRYFRDLDIGINTIYDQKRGYPVCKTPIYPVETESKPFSLPESVHLYEDKLIIRGPNGVFVNDKQVYYSGCLGICVCSEGIWINNENVLTLLNWNFEIIEFVHGNFQGIAVSDQSVRSNLIVGNPLRCINRRSTTIWESGHQFIGTLNVNSSGLIVFVGDYETIKVCSPTDGSLIREINVQTVQLQTGHFGTISLNNREEIFFWDHDWNLNCIWNTKGKLLIPILQGLIEYQEVTSRDVQVTCLGLDQKKNRALIGLSNQIVTLDF